MDDQHLDITDISELPEIPEDRNYFKIGEAAALAGVKPYILRYWESEFKSLNPKKTSSGHRMYSRADIELLLQIRTLLYEQMYTVAGARKRLVELQRGGHFSDAPEEIDEPLIQDPLEGARVAVLEQQVEMFQARLEAALRERKEALETARMATDALKEVELAAERASAEAQKAQERVEEVQRQARNHQDELLDQLEALRHQLDEAVLERDHLREALDLASASPAEPTQPQAEGEEGEQGGEVVELAELRRLQTQLTAAHQSETELRGRLRQQTQQRQRVLNSVRAEIISLLEVVQPKAGRA